MRYLVAFLAAVLLTFAPVAAQDIEPVPVNSVEEEIATLGDACESETWPGVVFIIPLGEYWQCPDSTDVWTQITISSPATPTAHATTHMSGGTATDPIAPFTQTWTRAQTITPSVDETALTVNATGASQTANIVDINRADGSDALRISPGGRAAFQDASFLAAGTFKGGMWTPVDEPTLEFWFRQDDITESCGEGDGAGTSMTANWDSVVNGYILDPVGGATPDVVCGPCCTEDACTDDYMPQDSGGPALTDCKNFTNLTSSNVPQHAEARDKSPGTEYFNLSPNYTISDETFTIVALIWQHFPGTSGHFMGDSDYANDWIEYYQNRSIGGKTAGAPDWANTGCGSKAYGVGTLDGDECNDAGNDCGTAPPTTDCDGIDECGDTTDGDGPGDWYVLTLQIRSDLAGEDLYMDEARVNGESKIAASPDLINCTGGGDFVIARFGSELKVAEIMGFASDLSTADMQLAENYLSNKYQLGIGADHNGGALDQDSDAIDSDALVCETDTATEHVTFDAACNATFISATTPQVTICYDASNCCTISVNASGDLDFGGATCDVTFTGTVEAYAIVKEEDTPLTARRNLNFIGGYVNCVDDGADTTDCTFTADVTAVFDCLAGDCTDIAAAEGDSLDFSGMDPDSAGEGLILSHPASCTGTPDTGTICYDDTLDDVCIYEGGWKCHDAAGAGGGGGGAFSDAGDPIVQNTTTKDVQIGSDATGLTGKLEIGGDDDQPQFVVQGNATQTDSLIIAQTSAGTEQFSVSPTGSLFMTEKAAADADVASQGQLWCKTATPNQLWFTDDAGTDGQVHVGDGTNCAAGSGAGGVDAGGNAQDCTDYADATSGASGHIQLSDGSGDHKHESSSYFHFDTILERFSVGKEGGTGNGAQFWFQGKDTRDDFVFKSLLAVDYSAGTSWHWFCDDTPGDCWRRFDADNDGVTTGYAEGTPITVMGVRGDHWQADASIRIQSCHTAAGPPSQSCNLGDGILLDGDTQIGGPGDSHSLTVYGLLRSFGSEAFFCDPDASATCAFETGATGSTTAFQFDASAAGHTGTFMQFQDEGDTFIEFATNTGNSVLWKSYAANNAIPFEFNTNVTRVDGSQKMFSWKDNDDELMYLQANGTLWAKNFDQISANAATAVGFTWTADTARTTGHLAEFIDDTTLRLRIQNDGEVEIPDLISCGAVNSDASGVLGCAPDLIEETELDSEAELEGQIADMANIIQATEIDTSSEVRGILTDEIGAGVIITRDSPELAKTAGSGEQGTGVCGVTNGICQYTTVGFGGDATLPAACVNCHVIIYNEGANTLTVYPASGDDHGDGTDAGEFVSSGNAFDCWGLDDEFWRCYEYTFN